MIKRALKKLLRIRPNARLRHELQQRLRYPANALIASASSVQKYVPYPARQGFYLLQTSNPNSRTSLDASLPIPPLGVRYGYGDTEEHWLNGGKRDVENMMKLLSSTEFSIHEGDRIIDLGCGPGRMIRWLASVAEGCDIWGVDIDARLIVWCQENLTPPFNFATVTTAPHLPFEDNYFDLVYCGSVFTHIDDLADAWLLELKRIVRPGGRVYVTVHDKHSADLIMNDPSFESHPLRDVMLPHYGGGDFKQANYYKCSALPGDANCQVFYDIDYLCRHWGRLLKIVAVSPEAYWHQTAILMEKLGERKG